MADGKVIYEVRADDSKLDGDLELANQKAVSGASKFGGAAKAAGLAIGGAVLAAGGAAITFGSQFETAMAGASTLFGSVEVDTDALNDKMLALSDSSGVAADELGQSLYNALSAGIPVTEDMGDALGFLEKSTKLAKAGFTDVDTAMSATVKTLNAYGMGVEETDRVQKILMQTQNLGIVTVGELGGVLAQVTPTAAAMGVEFEQVGAALAVMTAQGTPAAQATTQLNSLFAELGKSGTVASENLAEAAKGTEYAGKSFQELMADGVPLNTVLNLMGTYADNNGLSMLDMFSSIEAGKAALSTAGQNSEAFAEALSSMSAETDVVGDAFDKVTGTSAERFGKIMNELKNTAIGLFLQMAPLIEQALPLLGEVLDQLLPPIMELTGTLLPIMSKLFAAVLPPIAELANKLVPVLAGVLDELLPPFLSLAETILPILVDLFGVLLEPIGELVDTLLPVLAEILEEVLPFWRELADAVLPALASLFDELMPFIEQLVDQLLPIMLQWLEKIIPVYMEIIESVLPVLIELFQTLLPPLMELISEILPPLTELFFSLVEPLLELVQAILPPILELFQALMPVFSSIIEALSPLIEIFIVLVKLFVDSLMPVITTLAELFTKVLSGALSGIMPIVTTVIDIFGGLLDFIAGVFTGDWSKAWDGVVKVFKGIFNLIPAIVEGVVNGAISIINGIISGINMLTGVIGIPEIPEIPSVSIPRLRVGLDYVPYDDFPAMLHKGEMVLTAEEARAYRENLGAPEDGLSSPVAPERGVDLTGIGSLVQDAMLGAMAQKEFSEGDIPQFELLMTLENGESLMRMLVDPANRVAKNLGYDAVFKPK